MRMLYVLNGGSLRHGYQNVSSIQTVARHTILFVNGNNKIEFSLYFRTFSTSPLSSGNITLTRRYLTTIKDWSKSGPRRSLDHLSR